VFIAAYRSRLREAFRAQAPRAVLRFVPESDVDDDAMDQGRIDLHIGAARQYAADVKQQMLFNTSFVGLAHVAHPIFGEEIDPARLVAFDHIAVSRRGRARGPLDEALDVLGLKRRVALIVPTFHAAIFAAADADLVLPQMPHGMLGAVQRLGLPLRTFELPIPQQTVVITQAWHPRLDHDRAHQWLRRTIKALCDAQ
jgi:DNA-binding transcriptional LysR family regulator